MAVREESSVLIEGPWTHRDVSANGIRMHVAEQGSGPLVLLLHGFPQFWWCWRAQLAGLAAAGYRAAAPDLRGYGASDKPPRGYDALTLTADVAGLVRALGERSAVVVGAGWGGLLGWVLATVHPELVRRLVVVGMPHPLRLRQAALSSSGQRRTGGHLARFQLPWLPERWLVRDDAANVERLLRSWAAPGWPDEVTARRYREAMLLPGVAHCSVEPYRWAVRSLVRPDGARAARLLGRGVAAPTLALHGTLDRAMLPATARGSERYVRADYQWREIAGAGHFAAEECPDQITAELVRWAGGPTIARSRDDAGRPRNARRRDDAGRPLPLGAAGHLARPEDAPVPSPRQALAEATALAGAGRPFPAHEVLEAVWKAAPPGERELWRGLAQLMVGLTHVQRGNGSGAVALLRRGAERISSYAGQRPYDVPVADLVATSRALADLIERDGVAAVDLSTVVLPLGQAPLGKS